MTPELTVLALAGLLQMVQFLLMAIPANMELGTGKTLSPRDIDRLGKPMVDLLSARTARLHRALSNHYEALVLFTIAVVVVTLSDSSTPFTATCAWTYLVARILYVPAYAFGWVPWRSVFFTIGWLASGLMIGAALL